MVEVSSTAVIDYRATTGDVVINGILCAISRGSHAATKGIRHHHVVIAGVFGPIEIDLGLIDGSGSYGRRVSNCQIHVKHDSIDDIRSTSGGARAAGVYVVVCITIDASIGGTCESAEGSGTASVSGCILIHCDQQVSHVIIIEWSSEIDGHPATTYKSDVSVEYLSEVGDSHPVSCTGKIGL